MSEPPKPPQAAPETADLLTSVRELQAPLIAAQMEYEKVMAEFSKWVEREGGRHGIQMGKDR